MIAVDTNILVYAHREDSAWHDAAYAMVGELAEGRAPWAIPCPSMITSKPAIDDHPKTGQRRGDRDRVVLAFCLLVKQVHFGSPTTRTAF